MTHSLFFLFSSDASFWMIADVVANVIISDPVFKAITLDIIHVYLVWCILPFE